MTINKLSEDSAKVAASLEESIPKRIDSLNQQSILKITDVHICSLVDSFCILPTNYIMQKMIAAISYHKLKVSIRITFLDLT